MAVHFDVVGVDPLTPLHEIAYAKSRRRDLAKLLLLLY